MPSKKAWAIHVERCRKATKAELLEGLFNVSRDRRAARLRLRREREARANLAAQLASLNDSLEDEIEMRAADRLACLRDAEHDEFGMFGFRTNFGTQETF